MIPSDINWTRSETWIYPPNWDGDARVLQHGNLYGCDKMEVQYDYYCATAVDLAKEILLVPGDFYTSNADVCTTIVIEEIRYHIVGMAVQLWWDMSPDQIVAYIPGAGTGAAGSSGKIKGPLQADDAAGLTEGETGNLVVTTVDCTAKDTISLRLKIKIKA